MASAKDPMPARAGRADPRTMETRPASAALHARADRRGLPGRPLSRRGSGVLQQGRLLSRVEYELGSRPRWRGSCGPPRPRGRARCLRRPGRPRRVRATALPVGRGHSSRQKSSPRPRPRRIACDSFAERGRQSFVQDASTTTARQVVHRGGGELRAQLPAVRRASVAGAPPTERGDHRASREADVVPPTALRHEDVNEQLRAARERSVPHAERNCPPQHAHSESTSPSAWSAAGSPTRPMRNW